MKRFIALALLLCVSCGMPAQAQTATDVNEGVCITADATTGAQTLAWWSRSGRTYFVQQSYDLVNWTYVPTVCSRADAVDGLNFACTDDRQFWRLKYTDAAPGGLYGANGDADDDGLSNAQELAAGTDPFNPDSDGDNFYDGQEIAQGSNPLNGAVMPNPNQADNENPAMTEQSVQLFEQTKSVTNHWYGGSLPPSSDISWIDYAGNSGAHNYSGSSPIWSDQLAGLSYPTPQSSPSNNYNGSGSFCYSQAELRVGGSGGSIIGYASIAYRQIGLYSYPTAGAQPWTVSRNYFTYRRTLPSPNPGTTPPVFENLDMVPLQIYKGQIMTMGGTIPSNKFLMLEPPATMGSWLSDFVVGLTVTPINDDGLALDNTGIDQWLTLPTGGNGVQVTMLSSGIQDNLTFQAVGGGVTPELSSDSEDYSIYYENYKSDTAGDTGKLSPALDDGTGNLQVAAHPLLRFDVKPVKQLKVTVQRIGRRNADGSIVPIPAPPSEADLEAYLDSIFVPQVNVHTDVKMDDVAPVYVAFDVGLKQSYGSNYRNSAGNNKLEILQGQFSDTAKLLYSDEETAIMTAAPPDTAAAITIYWVDCDTLNYYNWDDKATEDEGDPSTLMLSTLLGNASKAADHYRTVAPPDTRARVIWVIGRGEDTYQHFNSGQMFNMAHELGHALGNLLHTIERYALGAPGTTDPNATGPWSGYSAFSDNNLRLMTGMAGPKRLSGPKLLNKLERDKISIFNYVIPTP